jgi:ABC-type multidrug transport system ATPase subunit
MTVSPSDRFVPQELDLTIDLELTAAENLYVQVRLRWDATIAQSVEQVYEHGEGASKIEKFGALIIEVLAKLDLLQHANTLAANLSGGQRRRLAIATECIKPSAILFLDEPTTGQDAVTALEIVRLLKKLASGLEDMEPKTVVLIIHQPRSEIFALVDDVVLLSKGRCVFAGPTADAAAALETAGAASPIATRKSRRTLVGKRRPLHHAGSSSHHISLHDSSNPADQIMDAVASLSAEGVELAANAVARRFQTQAKVDTGVAEDGKQHVIAIAPLWHRTAALVLRRTWKESFATRLSNCPGPPAAVKRP